MLSLTVPLRTGLGLNERDRHFGQRVRRVAAERSVVAWALLAATKGAKPALPCVVTLTRLGPTHGLDDDGCQGSLKGVRDQVAEWLGVDDRRSDVVRYEYRQERAKKWSVRIAFSPMAPVPQRSGQRSDDADLRERVLDLADAYGSMAVVNAAIAVNEALARDATQEAP